MEYNLKICKHYQFSKKSRLLIMDLLVQSTTVQHTHYFCMCDIESRVKTMLRKGPGNGSFLMHILITLCLFVIFNVYISTYVHVCGNHKHAKMYMYCTHYIIFERFCHMCNNSSLLNETQATIYTNS